MGDAPRIVVAVATRDRPRKLDRCLRALAAGAVRPAAIVVVDQGAVTAATVAASVADETGVAISHVHQTGRGLSRSRNAAVESIEADVIAFMDDDCVADDAWLSAATRGFADADVAAVTGRVLPLGTDAPGLVAIASREDARRRDLRRGTPPWEAGTGSNLLVRSDWIQRVGTFDERLGAGSPGQAAEDVDYLYRLLRADATIRYLPEAIVYHERQPVERRQATRTSYGFGVGRFCRLRLGDGDVAVAGVLGQWLRLRAGRAAGAARRRDTGAILEEGQVVAATLRGLVASSPPRAVPHGRLARIRRPAILGTLRRVEPLSAQWGFDRGTPIDRHYIELFLAAHASDIRGATLEVQSGAYCERFGRGITTTDVLDIDADNTDATIVGDLADAGTLPPERFDCFVLTQTLHLIYDLRAAIESARAALRPGGVLLATVPTLSRVPGRIGPDGDYWRLTGASARRLFGDVFGPSNVEVVTFGNVLTGIAFLTGLAAEELRADELLHRDPRFPMLVAVRAVRAS